jgi:hypothetical protein
MTTYLSSVYVFYISQPTTLRLQLIIPHVSTGESHPVLHNTNTETLCIGSAALPPINIEIDVLFNFKFFKFFFFMIVNFKLNYFYS